MSPRCHSSATAARAAARPEACPSDAVTSAGDMERQHERRLAVARFRLECWTRTMSGRRRRLSLLGSAALLAACRSGPAAQRAQESGTAQYDGAPVVSRTLHGPDLRLVDSIILQEADTAFLGRLPHTFTVDDAGSIYIADRAADRLMRFRRDGALDAVIGKHGNGPGEFNRIVGVTMPLDSILVERLEGTRLVVLDSRTGVELRRLQSAGRINSWARAGPDLVLGFLAPGTKRAVAVIPIESLLSGGDELIPDQVGLPDLYRQYQHLLTMASVEVAAWTDTVLVGFGPANLVVRHAISGGTDDTIRVPVRARRGMPGTGIATFNDPAINPYDAVSTLSMLMSVWRMSQGRVLLWHQDESADDPSTPRPRFLGTAFLTVLSPGLDQACVDGELTAPGTGLPRLTLHADTLYSLDQVIDQPGLDSVRTVIRRYVIDDQPCDWLPLKVVKGGAGGATTGPGE